MLLPFLVHSSFGLSCCRDSHTLQLSQNSQGHLYLFLHSGCMSEGMRKEASLIPTPIRRFLQKCALTILSLGHWKTHEAVPKEEQAGQLYQAERIFCGVCLWASLKDTVARMSPQIDASSLHYTADISQTSLTLDHASPPWPQLCKITAYCLVSSKLQLIPEDPPSVPLSRYCSMKNKHPLQWRGLAVLRTHCEVTHEILQQLNIALRIMPKPAKANTWKKHHPNFSSARMLLCHTPKLGHSSLCFLYNFWKAGD